MLAQTLPLTSPTGVILVLFAAILVLPRLAERVRLPGLVGLVIGGTVLGPTGLGVVDRAGAVALLGGAGLLYLMFEAGLEMDRDVLREARRPTVVFGILTFAFPFAVGYVIHRWLDFPVAAALLLASCWSSHTLLAYPLFQRARVVANRAVTVGVGGTIITDTAALLVLVAIARHHQGDLSWGFALTRGPLLVAAAVMILVIWPRVAAWFFASIGQERSARFLFVMVSLFGAAGLAQAVGVEPIIGAFLAGLALNRMVTEGSALANQVSFFGANFLVPIFLISVGMLVDPSLLFAGPDTATRAVGFTVAVVVGKAAAAYVTGRLFHWRRAEIGALFSLSVAQAAATLAAVFVGFEIGLIDETTVNAVIIVIVVTCLVSSMSGRYVASRLPQPPTRLERLGRRVLVPMSVPAADDQVIHFASLMAAADGGTVLPLTILDRGAASGDVRDLREHMVDGVERAVLALGADAQSEVRLDVTPGAGMLHAAVEQDATCIMMGWKGWSTRRESFFGEQVDALVLRSPVPVLVMRAGVGEPRRVVLALDAGDLRLDGRPGLELAHATASRLAAGLRLPIELAAAVTPEDLVGVVDTSGFETVLQGADLASVLGQGTESGDVIVTGLPATRFGLGRDLPRLARSVPARTLVVASPPRTSSGAIRARM